MNRNTESHFAQMPKIDIERSIFDRSSDHKTSFNTGELIPFFWDEVLPGDTFNVATSIVARLQTLLTPIFDNVYMDTYYFFVPARLTWSHWKEFMGENTESAWIPETTYSTPKISSPENGWNTGTIADYLGIPVGVDFNSDNGLMPSALPFRAYSLICNEWFRDQNLSDPLNIPIGDSYQTGSNGDEYINDVANGGAPFKVSKYHDYFTSCLPSPQKGPSVGFSFSSDINFGNTGYTYINGTDSQSQPVIWNVLPVITGQRNILADNTVKDTYRKSGDFFKNQFPFVYMADPDSTAGGIQKFFTTKKNGTNLTTQLIDQGENYKETVNDSFFSNDQHLLPMNAFVNIGDIPMSGSTDVSFTINELRLAFQLQKFYEKNARGGSRYRELLLAHFGVTSPDARMMIPEYLGGHRFPLSINQVLNQSQSASDYLGDVGAMSNTADYHEDFIKSFTEHGFVFGVCCVRYDHSYPQGLSREWTRNSALDYYWPVFANIGEQPVYKYEINATPYVPEDENDLDYDERKKVFGYQEAWASYRYKPSRVSAEMRPGVTNSLSSWHLADHYSGPVSLSDEWIREEKSNVDRVLAVTSATSNQVFADFYVRNRCTRAMPMYSIPGLIDHH